MGCLTIFSDPTPGAPSPDPARKGRTRYRSRMLTDEAFPFANDPRGLFRGLADRPAVAADDGRIDGHRTPGRAARGGPAGDLRQSVQAPSAAETGSVQERPADRALRGD